MIADDELVDPAPGPGPLSTQITERPLRPSSNATADPMTPAPITTASACERSLITERTYQESGCLTSGCGACPSVQRSDRPSVLVTLRAGAPHGRVPVGVGAGREVFRCYRAM